MGPNIFPSTDLIPEAVFKRPAEEYFAKMSALALKVMDVIALGMPYGPNVFDEFCSNDPVASIRLLHYPPDTSNDERQYVLHSFQKIPNRERYQEAFVNKYQTRSRSTHRLRCHHPAFAR